MIERYDVNEDYAHSGIIKAGYFEKSESGQR